MKKIIWIGFEFNYHIMIILIWDPVYLESCPLALPRRFCGTKCIECKNQPIPDPSGQLMRDITSCEVFCRASRDRKKFPFESRKDLI